MTSIRAEVYIDQAAMRAKVNRAVDPVLRERAEDAGKEMVRIANALMAGQFNLNRPYERRRYPGSRRASTALTHVVTGSNSQYTVGYRVLGGEEVLQRILGMNYGMGGERVISPNGNWDLRGARLAVRDEPTGAGSGGGRQLAWQENGVWTNVKGSVTWKPTGSASRGTGFLEEARDAAVAQIR